LSCAGAKLSCAGAKLSWKHPELDCKSSVLQGNYSCRYC
jgi:hypothetical protein